MCCQSSFQLEYCHSYVKNTNYLYFYIDLKDLAEIQQYFSSVVFPVISEYNLYSERHVFPWSQSQLKEKRDEMPGL